MDTSRFAEYSGDEAKRVSLDDENSLRALERTLAILMYEEGVSGSSADKARVGYIRQIQVEGRVVSFRFRQVGELTQRQVIDESHRLQFGKWESTRTHWAIKDGEIPEDLISKMVPMEPSYDVVLSFAGEDRDYVHSVAEFLNDHGVNFFYDKNEQSTLWGKDLSEHLDLVYRKLGRYCVMFISMHYAEKMWTTHERRSAFSRAIEQRTEYLLPVRFDDTEIPGLRSTIGYIAATNMSPAMLGQLILEKLGRRV